ncbi:MAG: valine--tRNA ligase [Flavobacteriales bacterium]|nr:valine--tRNA ligase [Flavobacteriales bacterium]|tara:strand:+ start:6410 stop:9031 length:2622 start_codon:yes stop_codon:yes gene_type:complete
MNKKYQQKENELKWYDYWIKNNFFTSKPNEKKSYTILMPPPNVTGVLHMGHMLNNTIQDILARRARLLGLNVCWVPGTDHASIATENKVFDKLKSEDVDIENVSRKEFINHCWDWTNKHGGIILKQLKRLGCSCDWDRVKFTMDDDMSESVTKAFVDLYKKGFIYRGQRMINWDPYAHTAISDEEVIYKEQQSNLYYIDYKIVNSDRTIQIATTRPETILGDTAICVHPKDMRYTKLIGSFVLVPIINRKIPVITDSYIDPEFGTGALKVTPAHDTNDFDIGLKNNLDVISVIDSSGKINEHGGNYCGLDRFEARKKIIKDIEKTGQLSKIESINNKVGFSERTDVVIEPRLSTQWFMKMDKLVQPAIENVENGSINFFPEKFKNTYSHWMNNIKDWCLSRQLWWGHQIPAYFFNDNDFVVANNIDQALILAQQKSGNHELTTKDLRQEKDVLDTWFSSWLWPLTVFDGIRKPKNIDFNYYYPTCDLVTGPDILFFWVARMIMAGYSFGNQMPFQNVYFTGIVRDKDRKKMSKSLGNSPDPIKLIDDYGADGVRVAMLFASPAGNDLLFDEELCKQGRNFTNKIWNAFLLIESWNAQDCKSSDSDMQLIRWFESLLNQKIIKLNQLFSEFRISDALILLYKLLWDDFCSCYLEMIKPRNKHISSDTLNTTKNFFEKILICLHPFMPFLTEELFHKINTRKNNSSILLSNWPKLKSSSVNEHVILEFSHVLELIKHIRKIRKDKKIPYSEPLILYSHNDLILRFSKILKKACNLEKIELYDDQEGDLFEFLVGVNQYCMPLVFNVNISEEIQHLNEKIKYFEVFLNTIHKKIQNPQFMNNAPKNVIEHELKKEKDTIEKIKSLQKQLKILNDKK